VGEIVSNDNLKTDPRFVNPASGDYRLGPGSQAIDAGLDVDVTVDLDGTDRPQDEGFDIGAYEFSGAANSGGDFTVYLPQVVK
jgi:hypothetical protein